VRICLTNVSFFRNALGPRAADLPIALIQCPRIILLGLGFDVVFDCSIVYIPVVDIRTLFATLPEEILWGLLLRHRRQQMKQYRRRDTRKRSQMEERHEKRVLQYHGAMIWEERGWRTGRQLAERREQGRQIKTSKEEEQGQ
jgi:hypothetical protein